MKSLLGGIHETKHPKDSEEALLHDYTLDEITKHAVLTAIERFNGNKTQAARYLGVSRSFLYRHLSDDKKVDS